MENQQNQLRRTPILTPVIQKGEVMWRNTELTSLCADDINNGDFFYRKVKSMNIDFEKANHTTNDMMAIFNTTLNSLLKKEQEISEASKRASGNVRKSANELSEGLAKLEKVANFQNLEKYCLILERSASALTVLADLEKSGVLERISKAIK